VALAFPVAWVSLDSTLAMWLHARRSCLARRKPRFEAVPTMMRMEVEQKFPVPDFTEIRGRLKGLGARFSEPKSEADTYYQHPARDFAVTDEALRIRRAGDACSITYKGPKIDSSTKTRREIDLPLPEVPGSPDSWGKLLEALGFTPIAEVRKDRTKAHVAWEGCSVEVSLDSVGHLGTFVELELVVDSDGVPSAKACIQSLAGHLGLSDSERRSYLELLLSCGNSGA
jgi:adenylate cyclase class 2